jgi:hemerythrin-like domain-containing protein
MIDIAEDEHHQVEKLLMKLQAGGGATEDWLLQLRTLRGMLQRHILKEETDVFHLAQTLFSTAEAADMAARFLEGKGRLGMENPLSLAAHAVKDMLT